ncbi:Sodium/calcium exchanger protein-domain-containing protein [Leptodontidium sp. 2 PMI_412]|nr:Sodium/calcium exchanger protein-domain-containing protein [Leptodontidium sp. MPI-SDFR-AT-0119]KAH9213320.1 Sodium/calcium exchanger protein-domain-containing protein [Leptodontidium sp. 2 PMI_412]
MTFNMHSIKRQARKEAWYSDSWNPFRKTGRAKTWAPDGNDIEAAPRRRRQDDTDETPLSAVQTEPAYHSRQLSEGEVERPRNSKDNEYEMTTASSSHGKAREADSEETVVDHTSTRPRSQEEKARKRFLSRFSKNNKEDVVEEEEKEKKRPWYKGKILPHKEPFTVRNQIQRTIFNSWINILLLAAPVGIALNYAGVDKKAVFVVNFIAIIPLAAMLSFATEEIALHVGESLGGLLNASFGNAVEMIVAIIALAHDEVLVVQTSLIGSILSNLLLVLGMCFFFGGLRRTEQFFNKTVAQTAASLLALAVGSVIIPTCFDQFSAVKDQSHVAALSRGTSVILLVVYLGYLYFQLKTHAVMFNEESQKVAMRPRKHKVPAGAISKGLAKAGGVAAGAGRATVEDRPPNDELINANAYEDADDEEEEPQLHIAVAWATLAGATAIIGLCAEFMVDSISAITASGAISIEFVGLILLPIVGNAAEHATAVTVAVKDKMDLAIGVAVGSSMQVSLFLIPLLVIIGWIMGKDDMDLSFDGFQIAVLFVAVLLVNYLIGDGKSHWLEGMLLQCLYLIIAVCAWYYPQTDGNGNPVTEAG